MEPPFKKGNIFQEQQRNGWIYGSFMPEGDLAKDERAEIKIAVLDNAFAVAEQQLKDYRRVSHGDVKHKNEPGEVL